MDNFQHAFCFKDISNYFTFILVASAQMCMRVYMRSRQLMMSKVQVHWFQVDAK